MPFAGLWLSDALSGRTGVDPVPVSLPSLTGGEEPLGLALRCEELEGVLGRFGLDRPAEDTRSGTWVPSLVVAVTKTGVWDLALPGGDVARRTLPINRALPELADPGRDEEPRSPCRRWIVSPPEPTALLGRRPCVALPALLLDRLGRSPPAVALRLGVAVAFRWSCHIRGGWCTNSIARARSSRSGRLLGAFFRRKHAARF